MTRAYIPQKHLCVHTKGGRVYLRTCRQTHISIYNYIYIYTCMYTHTHAFVLVTHTHTHLCLHFATNSKLSTISLDVCFSLVQRCANGQAELERDNRGICCT